MAGPEAPHSFRLAHVPGVTPGKWARIWEERFPEVALAVLPVDVPEAVALVRDGRADAAVTRLPVDRTGLHAIPLYAETSVVVVPKEHFVAAADVVSSEDLADEVLLHPQDDVLEWERPPGRAGAERPVTTAAAFERVAAGDGLLVVPQSLARLHHRKDLTWRPVSDAPESGVALVWLDVETTDLMERFIGVVRGRTVNSSRGRPQPEPAPAKAERGTTDRRERRTPAAGNRKGGGPRRTPRPSGRRGRRR
ncbi:LysR substrate-binding domain-containing protein [Actinoalloteichus spitiensis]|uniref:LysR substrate-binding domain-containing protein n=1 Tax=Actinoalloteichus spitiensis TaxID=252394 RepID=UPI000375E18B|nr:LysR substrate-binding domain-containing protein [Actinoalloteichus spitiensis]